LSQAALAHKHAKSLYNFERKLRFICLGAGKRSFSYFPHRGLCRIFLLF
jgi:hypothetical protein